jgi:hypothetical protein
MICGWVASQWHCQAVVFGFARGNVRPLKRRAEIDGLTAAADVPMPARLFVDTESCSTGLFAQLGCNWQT